MGSDGVEELLKAVRLERAKDFMELARENRLIHESHRGRGLITWIKDIKLWYETMVLIREAKDWIKDDMSETEADQLFESIYTRC